MNLTPEFKRESEKMYQKIIQRMKTEGISCNERISSFFIDFFFKNFNIIDNKEKIKYFKENSNDIIDKIFNYIIADSTNFECISEACSIQNIKTDFEAFLSK